MQVQLSAGPAVDLGDHHGPVHLDQGADQRAEPQQFITGTGQQVDDGAAGPVTAQPGGENDSRDPQLSSYKNGNTAWADPAACSRGNGCPAKVTSTWSSIAS